MGNFKLEHEATLLEHRVFHVEGTPSAEHEERLARLAAKLIRRQANQHDCRERATQAPCGHPEHRRDRFYAWAMLEALGVPRDLDPPTDDDYRLFLSQEVRPPSAATGRRAERWGYSNVSTAGRYKR